MANEFMNALQKARLDLALVENELKRLAQKKAQLLQTIAALAPLTTEEPSRESLTLADAIRTVTSGYEMNNPGTVFSPKLVRILLQEMGFDLTPYKNHMASIHTALRRMARAGQFEEASDLSGGYRCHLLPETLKKK
jgi:hypothetical protein